MDNRTKLPPPGEFLLVGEKLKETLSALDLRLTIAAAAARVRYSDPAYDDPYRGLHISAEQIDALSRQETAFETLAGMAASFPIIHDTQDNPLNRLAMRFDLDTFERDTLLIAAAPELLSKYKRFYSYLHNDVARKAATVDLTLDLLCATFEERVARMSCFLPDSRLFFCGLLEDVEAADEQGLGAPLRLSAPVKQFLFSDGKTGQNIGPYLALDAIPASGVDDNWLSRHLVGELNDRQNIRLWITCEDIKYVQNCIASGAAHCHKKILWIDLQKLPQSNESNAREAAAYAVAHDALICVTGISKILANPQAKNFILDLLQREQELVVISAHNDISTPDIAELSNAFFVQKISKTPHREIVRELKAEASVHGLRIPESDLVKISNNNAMSVTAVSRFVARKAAQIRWDCNVGADHSGGFERLENGSLPTEHDHSELSLLADQISPRAGWDDVVLPNNTKVRLENLAARIRLREKVNKDWKAPRDSASGSGLFALFSGESGVGKSFSAEVIAYETGKPLYRVDPSRIVSKYIGDTEKNLDLVFQAAQNRDVILLWDECDAFCSKRTSVNDSRDKFANMEIAYLLQKMEHFDGVSLMTTNLRENIDDAFWRRFNVIVNFPFPEADIRDAIWQRSLANKRLPSESIPLRLIAERYKLSGGAIKNAAITAAYAAAAEGRTQVCLEDILQGIKEEYQKIGRPLSKQELAMDASTEAVK